MTKPIITTPRVTDSSSEDYTTQEITTTTKDPFATTTTTTLPTSTTTNEPPTCDKQSYIVNLLVVDFNNIPLIVYPNILCIKTISCFCYQ